MTTAKGNPAIASYRIEADGRLHAHHIFCVELRGTQVGWVYAFLGAAQFEAFPPAADAVNVVVPADAAVSFL